VNVGLLLGLRRLILLVFRSRRTASDIDRPGRSLEVDLRPLLEQREEQFAYDVVAGALGRSIAANAQLDLLFVAVMAAVAAVYAIILDKIADYSPAVTWFLIGAFGVSCLGVLLSWCVRDAPDPEKFSKSYPDHPRATRTIYIAEFVRLARQNERIRIFKSILLAGVLIASVAGLTFATADKVNGLRISHHESERRRVPSPRRATRGNRPLDP